MKTPPVLNRRCFLCACITLMRISFYEVLSMKKARIYHRLLPAYSLVLAGFLIGTILGNQIVTTVSEHAPLKPESCIIIDAGHGGVDGGAISCTGVPESKYNLDISLRLEQLMHLLGIHTKMIRTTDCSVYTKGETIAQKKVSDLKERVRITEETENPLLISIHQNYFSDSRYGGAQVFYTKSKTSRALAETLQRKLVTTLNPTSKRQAKNASGIYLMEHISCPGVLIECGFLSNPAEEAKLARKDYQLKLCCIIACVTSGYLNEQGTFA